MRDNKPWRPISGPDSPELFLPENHQTTSSLSSGEIMGYTSIVCGVTGSAHAQKAALEAAVLAKEHNARLTYVYVVDTSFLKGSIGGMSTSMAQEGLERIGAQILEFAGQLAQSQQIVPNKIVRSGPVLEALKQVLHEQAADLLVLGHEKRSFLDKVLFKGVVEDHVEELKKLTGVEVTVIK